MLPRVPVSERNAGRFLAVKGDENKPRVLEIAAAGEYQTLTANPIAGNGAYVCSAISADGRRPARLVQQAACSLSADPTIKSNGRTLTTNPLIHELLPCPNR